MKTKLSEIGKLVEEYTSFRVEVTPIQSELFQKELYRQTKVTWMTNNDQEVRYTDKKYLFVGGGSLAFSNKLAARTIVIPLVEVDYEN